MDASMFPVVSADCVRGISVQCLFNDQAISRIESQASVRPSKKCLTSPLASSMTLQIENSSLSEADKLYSV